MAALSCLLVTTADGSSAELSPLEAEFRSLKVRELKYRLRKRHGIVPSGVLDKIELVKMLAKAENDAVRCSYNLNQMHLAIMHKT